MIRRTIFASIVFLFSFLNQAWSQQLNLGGQFFRASEERAGPVKYYFQAYENGIPQNYLVVFKSKKLQRQIEKSKSSKYYIEGRITFQNFDTNEVVQNKRVLIVEKITSLSLRSLQLKNQSPRDGLRQRSSPDPYPYSYTAELKNEPTNTFLYSVGVVLMGVLTSN